MDRLATKSQLMRFASQEYQEQRRNGLSPAAAAAEATRQVWEHFPTEAALFRIPRPARGNPRTPKAKPRPESFGRSTAVMLRKYEDLSPEERKTFPRPRGYGRRAWRSLERAGVVSVPGRPGERLLYEVETPPAFVMPSAERSAFPPAPDDRKLMAARSRAILADAGPDTRTRQTKRCARCGADTPHLVGATYQACESCGKIVGRNPGVPLGAQHIRPGDRVTYVNRFGQRLTGRVVFALPTHLTLNMGGRYGTPAVINYADVVKVQPKRNPLTRTETAAVLGRARQAGRVARAYAGYSHGVAAAAKMAAYQDVAQDFGQAGGTAGRAARRAAAFGPAAPGDPDYRRNVPAHVLDAGWRAHKAAKKAGATDADATAAGLRAVWAQYPGEAAAWGIPRANPPRVLGPIPGAMREIRYQRTGRDRGPYVHKFGKNVKAFACADGSVVLRGPRPLFVNQ
jgi:hypothetical protein